MDMNVGDLAEYWVTLLEQFFPTGVGVAIEHGPASPTVRAFHGFRRIGIKVDHTTAMVDVGGEGMLGGWRHGSATAQRKDTVEILKHIGDEIGLDLAECRLTVFIEPVGKFPPTAHRAQSALGGLPRGAGTHDEQFVARFVTVAVIDRDTDKPRTLKRIQCQGDVPGKMPLDAWQADNYAAVNKAADDIADNCFKRTITAFGLE